jgi:hypothetical protein
MPPEARTRPPAGEREPAWRALAIGWLLAQALLAPGPVPWGPAAARAPPELALRPSPRALRSWPGIGEARALGIARARWEHPDDGPPLYLSDVPGIGAATERAVGAWSAAAGSGPGERAVHSLLVRSP